MQLNCEYDNKELSNIGNFYTCNIVNQPVKRGELIKKIVGIHEPYKTDNDVTAVSFVKCIIPSVPQGLTKIFPNLKWLNIRNSKLTEISREALKEYGKIKFLTLASNNITFLTGDLFDDLVEIELISLWESDVQLIEPQIFDKLIHLKHLNLRDNPYINKCFSVIITDTNNATLEEIKEELKTKTPPWIGNLKYIAGEITSDSLKQAREMPKYVFERIEKLKKENEELKKQLGNFQTVMADEDLKDVLVKTDCGEFRVHKFVLAARSPTLANILKRNIHVEQLDLIDVSANVIKVIFDFMYTNNFPPAPEDINCVEIFKASEKLKMKELMDYAALHIPGELHSENALEVMVLSGKSGYNDLQQRAFEKIKKMFDSEIIDEELINQPEKLQKLIEFKKKKNEMMAKFEAEFNSILGENSQQ